MFDKTDITIPLPTINKNTFEIINNWYNNKSNDEIMKKICNDKNVLFNLIMATSFLNIDKLLTVFAETCAKLLDKNHSSSEETIKAFFNIY